MPLDRHPLVVFLLGLCVLSGTASLITRPPTAPHVPAWVNGAWYGLLIVGGVIALVGVFLRDAVTGVLVVRAGLLPLGCAAYGYAAVLGRHGVSPEMLGAVVVVAFGVALHVRAAQITLHVRAARNKTRREAREAREAGEGGEGGRPCRG